MDLQKLAREELVHSLPEIGQVGQLCEACQDGKKRHTSLPAMLEYRAERRLELVHRNLCDPISPATPRGNKYFLLLVDALSRYMWVATISSKDRAATAIKDIQAWAEGESDLKLKALRTDRGGEFTATEFTEYCATEGVHHRHTTPYNPQQNDIIERRNGTVVATAKNMLKAKCLPRWFWGEVVNVVVYVMNGYPMKSVDNMTPFEAWHGRKPVVCQLRMFGCIVYMRNTTPHLKKIEDRGRKMIFFGYESGSKVYRAYDSITKCVHVTHDVVFDEQAQWDWGSGGDDGKLGGGDDVFTVEYTTTGSVAPTTVGADEALTEESPLPARAGNAEVDDDDENLDADHDDDAPLHFRSMSDILATPGFTPRALVAEELHLVSSDEPASFVEAEHSPSWRKAMMEEMDSIEENGTCNLVDLPPNRKPIGVKWVFKVKRDEHGVVSKHKACLVMKGYAQRHDIDYDEMFMGVARLDSMRLRIALVAHEGWDVHHKDAKSTFLIGDLHEEVYIEQSTGFIVAGKEHKVLKLWKELHELHQVSRSWNAKLDDTLLSLGFQRTLSEHTIYVWRNGNVQLVVGVYIDDLIITGSDSDDMKSFKEEMVAAFKMSNIGLLQYYLGIEVK
jgi:hypothetical protein